MKKNIMLNISKIVMILVPLINLALCTVYNTAIYSMEKSDGVGFLMFMFVLFGLVGLFNATRMKFTNENTHGKMVLSIVLNSIVISIAMQFGIILLVQFITCVKLDSALVTQGIILTAVTLVAYLVSLVTLIIGSIIEVSKLSLKVSVKLK